MSDLIWSERAAMDVEAALEHETAYGRHAARRFYDKIVSTARALTMNPEAGRTDRMPGTREFAVRGSPYLIIYRLSGPRIEILRLLHASRRWGY